MNTLQEAHKHDACYYGERPHWLIVLTRCRDSEVLSNSNFEAALAMLGGESDDIGVERSDHWAVGWVEYLVVNPAHSALVKQAEDIQSQLADYPVLDEDDYSTCEYECYQESWDSWGRDEYQMHVAMALATHYQGKMSDVWRDDEVCGAVRNLSSVTIDEFASATHNRLDWKYQSEGSGVIINIAGIVKATDFDKLSDTAINWLWEQQRVADIEKLGSTLGACITEVKQALQIGINSVTGYQALMQGSI